MTCSKCERDFIPKVAGTWERTLCKIQIDSPGDSPNLFNPTRQIMIHRITQNGKFVVVEQILKDGSTILEDLGVFERVPQCGLNNKLCQWTLRLADIIDNGTSLLYLSCIDECGNVNRMEATYTEAGFDPTGTNDEQRPSVSSAIWKRINDIE